MVRRQGGKGRLAITPSPCHPQPNCTQDPCQDRRASTMPYPSQINADSIVAAACEIIERDGVEALSLGKLAEALGVRAPSLYRYFENKAALIQAVNLRTLQALFVAFDEALSDISARAGRTTAQRSACLPIFRTPASPTLRARHDRRGRGDAAGRGSAGGDDPADPGDHGGTDGRSRFAFRAARLSCPYCMVSSCLKSISSSSAAATWTRRSTIRCAPISPVGRSE